MQHTHFDLDIEHSLRVNLEAERGLNVVSQTLLITLLHSSPLLLERWVVYVLEQPLKYDMSAG